MEEVVIRLKSGNVLRLLKWTQPERRGPYRTSLTLHFRGADALLDEIRREAEKNGWSPERQAMHWIVRGMRRGI